MYKNKILNADFYKEFIFRNKTLEEIDENEKHIVKESFYSVLNDYVYEDFVIRSPKFYSRSFQKVRFKHLKDGNDCLFLVNKKHVPLKNFVKPLLKNRHLFTFENRNSSLPFIEYQKKNLISNKLCFNQKSTKKKSSKFIVINRKLWMFSKRIAFWVYYFRNKTNDVWHFKPFKLQNDERLRIEFLRNTNNPKLRVNKFYPYYIRKRFENKIQKLLIKRKIFKLKIANKESRKFSFYY